jgi:guanylate kinase
MNELLRIDEFRNILDGYHLSKQALQTLSQTKLVLLVAPSSTGRNTIIRSLMKTGDYHFVVSDTTRKPRVNDGLLEQNGKEYWFRTENEMLTDLSQGKYLEAAIIHNQQVSGISVRELEKARDEDKIAITDAEVAGAENATKYKIDTICIFVLPPSFKEWQRRIHHRGNMNPLEFKRRMQSACRELDIALHRDYYHFIINDTIEHSVQQINELAKLGTIDSDSQIQGIALAKQLLLDTKILISEN